MKRKRGIARALQEMMENQDLLELHPDRLAVQQDLLTASSVGRVLALCSAEERNSRDLPNAGHSNIGSKVNSSYNWRRINRDSTSSKSILVSVEDGSCRGRGRGRCRHGGSTCRSRSRSRGGSRSWSVEVVVVVVVIVVVVVVV